MVSVIAGFVLLATAAGCGSSGNADGRTDVVAAFYPLAEAAERIGGDGVEVTNLTPPGSEPHDVELTAEQLDLVLDADVVLSLRGFQPALDDALARSDVRPVNLLDGLLEDRQVIAGDPHVWLDPRRWSRVVDALAETFDGVDGSNARAASYRREIDGLDERFEAGLSDCARDLMVTAHAAFGYLAERYGLDQQAVSGISPEAEPDPERLAEIADLVDERGARTIFTEPLLPRDVAETLARETGAGVATLDPLESLTDDQLADGEDYVSVMEDNLDALRDGLGCR
jgi:zinc transport system substrate-binding protein